MRLFLDEAGNTGGIIDKNEKLNYGTQRHFCLAAVVAHDLQSEQLLRQKYAAFKSRFASEKELKGNSLFAKENNDALEYFLDNIIDDIHFSICLYDKKFYLASLLLFAILGEQAREQFPVEYYSLVSDLSQEKDELFATFCKLTKRTTKASVHELFEYLKNYSYQHIPPAGNGLVFAVSEIQNKGLEEIFVSDFLKFGSYSNQKFANLINHNALSELLEVIEIEHNCDIRKIDIVHDNISGIDKMLREELKHLDVTVKFIDSQAEELIQLADNVASIFCKIINTIVRCWDTKTEWSLENEWILTQSARFLQKIGTQNIKFTVPIQSWALAFCVKDMFAPKCSKEIRNNLFFNSEYQHWCQVIIQNIAESDFSRHAACFDELYSSGGGEP